MAKAAIVIFGATGDLAQRMLFPSLYFLEADGLLADDLALVGCSRSALGDEAFAREVETAVRERVGAAFSAQCWSRLKRRLTHAAVDATRADSFVHLREALAGIEETIFYLSTSPSHFGAICRN